jgi:uncharacterized membrane protein YedE/YeeE
MAVATVQERAGIVVRVPNFSVVTTSLLMVCASVLYLYNAVSGRQAALFLVGVGAGLVLYHANFGFTSSWREFIVDRRGSGIRAQMLMLAVTCAVFFPALGYGKLFATTVRGSVSPVGIPVVVGAFLFGIGMQLGGGCASGTLYTAGGGNTRMLITLAAFIAGSVIATAHAAWWAAIPASPPLSLIGLYGPWAGLAISFVAFAALTIVTITVERSRHGELIGTRRRRFSLASGPWPLAAGALGLALVNIATLVLAGRPWGVTSAFALWGAKAMSAAGLNVSAWPYWSTPAQMSALKAPIAADVTSVMDIGIILGALCAAGLAGRFAPAWRVPVRSAAAAAVGGFLLGYGARIAYGCNIGAYFSGVSSGSLHGWVWLAAAFSGNVIGARFRPLFGMSV